MNKMVKLKCLCNRITDGAHYSPEGINEGIPMLSVKDMNENGFDYNNCKMISDKDYIDLYNSGCHPEINDILIAKDGSYLKHVFVVEEEREEAVLSSIGILKPNLAKVNPYYIKYYLTSDFVKKEVAKKYVSGSALPRIILKGFCDIDIPYKEILEQDRIVRVLKVLDNKIQTNNKINSELESMAKNIYDYWFLQFEFPNEEGKPYKSSGGKMVWNEELGREIPEGWEVGNLYNIANFVNGLACQKYRPIDNNFKLPVIKIKEMHDGITDETEYVRNDINEKYVINDGDILFSWSATLETMLWNGGMGGLNQHIFKVEPLNLPKYYVFLQLKKYIVNFKQMAEARKTTMGHITTEHIKQSRIAIPPIKVAKEFNIKVQGCYEKMIFNDIENRKLSSLRDFLLPLLMNGQVGFKENIEVKEVDIGRKEVAASVNEK